MTYRDDLQAARLRRDALARELREVRSRMEEYQDLARQEDALEREIAQTAQDIEQARTRVELPLLARVHVASPCKERWSDMTGNDHVRFCGRCEKNVYDLSSLTAAQAEALLREAGESMCVRFFRRRDGTILTSDCPVGTRRKRVWHRVATAAVAGGVAAAGIALADAIIDDPAGAPVSAGVAPSGERRDGPVEFTMFPSGEPPEQLESFSGGMGVGRDRMDVLSLEIERTKTRLAEAEARLAEAKTWIERVAARQELKKLRAEVRKLEAERRAAKEVGCLLSNEPRDC
jgi:hypothetical protein